MTMHRLAFATLLLAAVLNGTGCATLPDEDPLEVTVAGVESLEGEGMELRMNVKLRMGLSPLA